MREKEIIQLSKNIKDYAQKCRDAQTGKIKSIKLDGNQIDVIPKLINKKDTCHKIK